jgi:hypothetical protein
MNRDVITDEVAKKRKRLIVHLSFAILFFMCVMIFKWINDKSIIDVILKVAGYTYGPLLGLFAFGILTDRVIKDKLSLWVCIASPLIILGIDILNNPAWFAQKLKFAPETLASLQEISDSVFGGFKFGIEILILNGLLTYFGLWLISHKR